MERRKRVVVLMPALNEAEAIQAVIQEIPRRELELAGYDVHVLIVDNGSTDGTGALAQAAGAEVITEPKRGYGRAYKTGLGYADGDIIVCVDADLTYPVAQLHEYIYLMETEGLDFLTTDRLKGLQPGSMTYINYIGNMLLSGLTRILFGILLSDSQSGMWIIRESLLDQLQLKSDGMSFSQEIKIKAISKAKAWKVVAITYRKRKGRTRLRALRDGWANLVHLLKLRLEM